MATVQLRRYELVPGQMDDFLAWFPRIVAVRDKFGFKVLFAYAGRSLPEIAGYPLIADFGRTRLDKAFLRIYTVGAELGRSFALARGVPADRVEAWRTAFQRMLADKELRAEMERRRMRFDPLTGNEVEALVAGAMAFPPEMLPGIKGIFEQVLAGQK